MNKRIGFVFTLTVIVATVAFFGARIGIMSQSGTVPFTATKVEKRFSGTGEQVYTETIIEAVRGDGSHVRVMKRVTPWNEPCDLRVITDLARKKTISIDPSTESITTYPMSAQAISHPHLAKTPRGAEELPESATILAYQVVKRVNRYPGSGKLLETWVAPELGFVALREKFWRTNSADEPVRVSTSREVVSIDRGDPDPALFDLPSSYVERSPSEALLEHGKKYGQPSLRPHTQSVLDDVYQKSRSNDKP